MITARYHDSGSRLREHDRPGRAPRAGRSLSHVLQSATLIGTVVTLLLNVSCAFAQSNEASDGLSLTIPEAVLMALEQNRAMAVARLSPQIQRTFEQTQRASFDPVLSGEIAREDSEEQNLNQSGSAVTTSKTQSVRGNVALDQELPTGTRITLDGSTEIDKAEDSDVELAGTRLGLTVSQSLLQGFGTGANLADLRQARLETAISEYEFSAFAMTLVALVERSCWNYDLARAQVDIVHESQRLAEQQLSETLERIRIGKLAAVERAAAEAEVAFRREAVINAESDLTTARLHLLRLLNAPTSNLWNRAVEIRIPRDQQPPTPDDPEDHVQVAMRLRPDLNEARLALERNELEVVKTRNGLLPKLDFFITLGRTGYAESFSESVGSDDADDVTVGLLAQYPLGTRSERAAHRRAVLSREQAVYAVENLSQVVQVDVRTAYVEMRRAEEQVAATRATRKLQEETLRAETEKYRIGKSTSLLVAQAQRDYVQSQLNEAQAVANSFKAAIDLYRLDGSLLERRGLNVQSAQQE